MLICDSPLKMTWRPRSVHLNCNAGELLREAASQSRCVRCCMSARQVKAASKDGQKRPRTARRRIGCGIHDPGNDRLGRNIACSGRRDEELGRVDVVPVERAVAIGGVTRSIEMNIPDVRRRRRPGDHKRITGADRGEGRILVFRVFHCAAAWSIRRVGAANPHDVIDREGSSLLCFIAREAGDQLEAPAFLQRVRDRHHHSLFHARRVGPG